MRDVVNFDVSTISVIHVETVFDITTCSQASYVKSHCFKICSFLRVEDILHIAPEEKLGAEPPSTN